MRGSVRRRTRAVPVLQQDFVGATRCYEGNCDGCSGLARALEPSRVGALISGAVLLLNSWSLLRSSAKRERASEGREEATRTEARQLRREEAEAASAQTQRLREYKIADRWRDERRAAHQSML